MAKAKFLAFLCPICPTLTSIPQKMPDNTLSDKEVLKESLRNPRYFAVLVDRYQDAFLRRSLSITRNKEEAEDVVQETFLKIYKNGKRWQERKNASFKSWAYTILRNTCYSHYKRQKQYAMRIVSLDFNQYEFEDDTIPTLEENPDGKRTYVESILSLMPASLAKMLRLYFLEERSQKEIAQIENISLGAVRTRIHRAKNSFRQLNTHGI